MVYTITCNPVSYTHLPAVTVNVVCGSGLNCVNMAAQMIKAGDADIVVAGGMENMSMAPYADMSGRYGHRMNNATLVDTMVNDALWDAFNNYHMGITAENVAEQWGLTREQLDEFAATSQQKCEAAQTVSYTHLDVYKRQVPDRSVSVRVSSLTIVPYTVPGRLQKKAMRPLL